VLAYGRMIRFSHTVSRCPFALTSAALAAQVAASERAGAVDSWWPWWARAAPAMASTAWAITRSTRGTPAPRAGAPEGPALRGECGGSSWSPPGRSCSPRDAEPAVPRPVALALVIVFGYSYTKRFTALSPLVLGLALAVAPVGAWLAIRGSFHPVRSCSPWPCSPGWRGSDTIYACQDAEVDRQAGLSPFPRRLGVRKRSGWRAACSALGRSPREPVLAGPPAPPYLAGARPSRACSSTSTRWSARPTSLGSCSLQPERLGQPALFAATLAAVSWPE